MLLILCGGTLKEKRAVYHPIPFVFSIPSVDRMRLRSVISRGEPPVPSRLNWETTRQIAVTGTFDPRMNRIHSNLRAAVLA